MRFIDLFAGLGGFHKALSSLGHECVFASEINPSLAELYERNWGLRPIGDIRKATRKGEHEIPDHDILCAGFPCQPFSKAGKQAGLSDETRGTLLDDIVMILKKKQPRFFILENVPSIATHNDEKTWNYMKSALEGGNDTEPKLYEVDHHVYSPHQFGIPQHRYRIFIVGGLIESGGLEGFSFEEVEKQKANDWQLQILDYIEDPGNSKPLGTENLRCLELWQSVIGAIPETEKLPGFPIWGMEFGATYPFNEVVPSDLSSIELGKFRGNFGISLEGMTKEEQMANLPSYSRGQGPFPKWKKKWIGQNRDFFCAHRANIERYTNEISKFQSQSWQKLEWNVGDGPRNLFHYLLQFRASGIRVKKVDYFPSLVCVSTQIPIIGWEKRYLTKTEAARLQGLDGILLPEFDNSAFAALGNAVNATIVGLIAERLVGVGSHPGNLEYVNHSN